MMKSTELMRILKTKFVLRITKLLAKMLLPFPSKPMSGKSVAKILVYGSMGIGNMIMLTPTLRALRQHFRDARIALIVDERWGAEEVVRGSSLVNEIIKRKPGGYLELLKLAMYIRSQNFDLLVSTFHGIGNNLPLLTALSGISYRAGHCTSPGWYSKYDYLYNIPVRMFDGEHEVERSLHIAEALGCTTSDRRLYINVDEDALSFAGHFFESEGLYDDDWILGVQVGIMKLQDWKQWDIQRLAQVCDQVMDRGVKVIVLGSPNHQNSLAHMLSFMHHQPIIALGKATLNQSAAIVKRCDATLCNDSGLMHISVAVGTPTIAIIGPTDYRRTGPYGNGHIMIKKDLPCAPCFTMAEADTGKTVKSCTHRKCLDLITVEDVLNAVEQMRKTYPQKARYNTDNQE